MAVMDNKSAASLSCNGTTRVHGITSSTPTMGVGDGSSGGTRSKVEDVGVVVYENKLWESEMEALAALCETFLPSVDMPMPMPMPMPTPMPMPSSKTFTDDLEILGRFFSSSAAGSTTMDDNININIGSTSTPDHVGGTVSQRLGKTNRWLVRLGLILLSNWMGTLILGGRYCLSSDFPYVHRFSKLDVTKRREIVMGWSTSSFSLLRKYFFGMKSLIMLAFFTKVNEKNENPSWRAIGYCGPDPDYSDCIKLSSNPKIPIGKPDKNNRKEGNGIINMSKLQSAAAADDDETILSIPETLRSHGFSVKTTSNSNSNSNNQVINIIGGCDAVVVGSGSGGGVVAGELAKQGYKVIVLEKGSYFPTSDLSLLEGRSLDQMYEGAGLLVSHDASVSILAGSTVGGGSTINWSASFKTPEHVIKEWSSDQHELGGLFDSGNYREAMDAVCEKMGVKADEMPEEEGLSNEVLRRGCEELGYPVVNVPRNAPKDHYCGWCFMGCKDGRKKGTQQTWLKEMVDSGNGVILTGCEARKVILSYYDNKNTKNRARARGVEFEYEYEYEFCEETQRKTTTRRRAVCVVESKVVVVACGALNTPVLLRNSGLKNTNIGRNLHIHPVVMGWGYFPPPPLLSSDADDHIINNNNKLPEGKRSYEGGIMTTMSTVTEDLDGSGYGVVLQTPSLHPGLFSALMPWTSALDFKVRMTKFSRTVHIMALARDRGSGRVLTKHPHDHNIIYHLKPTDERNLQCGLEKVLRILVAAGAAEIGTHHRSGDTIDVGKASPEDLERFIQSASRKRDLKGHATAKASAHQMGTCRMGIDPRKSVVGPTGETWEVQGLFVADSSVFPTALGINPMVTVMAIAYCTAKNVAQFLSSL